MNQAQTSIAEPALPNLIIFLDRLVGGLTRIAMGLSAVGVLVSLVLITYAIIMRYFLNSAPGWVDDTVGFLLVGTVMLAAASTLRQGGHINVDMLTERLNKRAKRWAEVWATLAVMVVSLMLIVNGWETAMSSKMLGIATSGNVEIPIYLLQLLMPLGGALMLLVSLETLIRMALGAPPLAAYAHHIEEVK